jgi:hypothetical protein
MVDGSPGSRVRGQQRYSVGGGAGKSRPAVRPARPWAVTPRVGEVGIGGVGDYTAGLAFIARQGA